MDDFDRVCLYAKAKNKEELTSYIKSGGNIGVLRQGIYSPIMQIAREGDEETVDFLSNHFPVNIHEAVQGAAMGSAFGLMRRLLAQGASLNYAIRGAGISGCYQTINALLDQGANVDQAVVGAALANHGGLVNALLRLGANVNSAVFGSAHSSEQDESLSRMRSLLKYRGGEVMYAVYGAAMAGHTRVVNSLDKRINLNAAIHAAGVGGNQFLINLFLSKGADLNVAVQGLATGGHGTLLSVYLTQGANVNYALTGATMGWQLPLMNVLLKKPDARIDAVKRGIPLDGNAVNLAGVLRLLVFLDNDVLREKLTDAMDWQKRFPTAMLLAKANYMHERMQRHDASYDDASSQFDATHAKTLLASALKPAESHATAENAPPSQRYNQHCSSWHLWRPSPDETPMATIPARALEMTEIPLASQRIS